MNGGHRKAPLYCLRLSQAVDTQTVEPKHMHLAGPTGEQGQLSVLLSLLLSPHSGPFLNSQEHLHPCQVKGQLLQKRGECWAPMLAWLSPP